MEIQDKGKVSERTKDKTNLEQRLSVGIQQPVQDDIDSPEIPGEL